MIEQLEQSVTGVLRSLKLIRIIILLCMLYPFNGSTERKIRYFKWLSLYTVVIHTVVSLYMSINNILPI